ncbi:alpha-1,3-mannosyl-glycoprotein 4-beta-N-acetylglucosaminyltransferase A isoform X2 [Ochlerotatus camptorhynchus]
MKMGLTSSLLRRRNCFLAFILVSIPSTILFLVATDFSAEQTMSQRVAEFQMRMQYLESMYRAKQEDVAILSQYLGFTNQNGEISNMTINLNLLDGLSADSRSMIRNATASAKLPANLKLPTAFHFLPHLLDDPASLRPGYLQTRNRQGVSIVLGIPTVKREKQSYLVETVDNLIANMDEEEQNDTMIVIFIGESDLDYVSNVANSINTRFPTSIESGFIEIISPAASYYPDMTKLRLTLNDSTERVKWRSKQNLDFVYLMAYAQPKGAFYVQLEDDILTKKGFITIMKKFALEKTAKKEQIQWFVLDFCQLGFIGE